MLACPCSLGQAFDDQLTMTKTLFVAFLNLNLAVFPVYSDVLHSLGDMLSGAC